LIDEEKEKFRELGLCKQCAAFRGRKGQEQCNCSLLNGIPGCHAPDYMKEWVLKDNK
jgi:hypothetical protein